MGKSKVYLDTNVISCLYSPETPERMIYTQRFWESVKNGSHDIYLSLTTIDEIHDCPEPKRTFMLIALAGIEYTLCEPDKDKALELAEMYIKAGGLPPTYKDDIIYIAYAALAECDIITSWNYRIYYFKVMEAVEQVHKERNYKRLDIYTPPSLIDFKDDE